MRNKNELEKRWRSSYQHYQTRTEKDKNFYLYPKTNDFFYTSNWHSHLFTIGVFSYLLDQDVQAFRTHVKESVLVYQELFEHFEQGDNVDPSYVTMLSYEYLFHALATGDIALAKQFSSHLGGRLGIEEKHNTPFIMDFGYTLKYFVEENIELSQVYLQRLANHCKQGRFYPFRGYVTVFEAILEKDILKANQGFKEITIGHDEECKGRGARLFQETEEEDICLWGIGLANLCFYYGLPVEIDDPLIPKDLLCPELFSGAPGSQSISTDNVYPLKHR